LNPQSNLSLPFEFFVFCIRLFTFLVHDTPENEGIGMESFVQDVSALPHDIHDDDLKINGKHTEYNDSETGEIHEKDVVRQTDQRDLSSDSEHEFLPQPLRLEYETLSINGSTSGTTNSSGQESLSDSTDDSCGSPDTLTIMAHAKHQLIATLMREVYTMFDP